MDWFSFVGVTLEDDDDDDVRRVLFHDRLRFSLSLWFFSHLLLSLLDQDASLTTKAAVPCNRTTGGVTSPTRRPSDFLQEVSLCFSSYSMSLSTRRHVVYAIRPVWHAFCLEREALRMKIVLPESTVRVLNALEPDAHRS